MPTPLLATRPTAIAPSSLEDPAHPFPVPGTQEDHPPPGASRGCLSMAALFPCPVVGVGWACYTVVAEGALLLFKMKKRGLEKISTCPKRLCDPRPDSDAEAPVPSVTVFGDRVRQSEGIGWGPDRSEEVK